MVLGAGHYPFAQASRPKVPKLANISSAAQSAIDFAKYALTDWRPLFGKPLASLDLLVNDAEYPEGLTFTCAGVEPTQVEAPTLANIISARGSWLQDIKSSDTLVFYCCGHGIWLPSVGNSFLASDFGVDEESPWPNAISLDALAQGLADKAPREQWLFFDCCASTAPQALRDTNPAPNPLVSTTYGMRKTVTDLYGPLVQAKVASASPGSDAFGRENGRSRFMDVFVEACEDAGFRDQAGDDRWWLTLQGLETAIYTYRFRVASPQDREYYHFSRVTHTDSTETPRLFVRDKPAACTLLVSSEPSLRLKQCDLNIYLQKTRIDGQSAGPDAQERFRRVVEPFWNYRVDAHWPEGLQTRERYALPPLSEVIFGG